MKHKAQAKQKEKPSDKPGLIKSLDQLESITNKRFEVHLLFLDKPLIIEARRLLPSEDHVLNNIVNEVFPPLIKGKTPEEDRPDITNPAFLAKKAALEIEARAMGIYWCVPIFHEAKPGLTDRKQVAEFVQSRLNDQILAILWQSINAGGVSNAEVVNFTSTNG